MHITVFGLPGKDCGLNKSDLAADFAGAMHRIDEFRADESYSTTKVKTDFITSDNHHDNFIHHVIAEVSAVVHPDTISHDLRQRVGKVVKQVLDKHLKGAQCVPPCPVAVTRVDFIGEEEGLSLHGYA